MLREPNASSAYTHLLLSELGTFTGTQLTAGTVTEPWMSVSAVVMSMNSLLLVFLFVCCKKTKIRRVSPASLPCSSLLPIPHASLFVFVLFSPVPHLPPLCLQVFWNLTCRPRGSAVQEGGCTRGLGESDLPD